MGHRTLALQGARRASEASGEVKATVTAAGYAIIRFGSTSWRLRPGEQLTFSRAEGCDIRLGHDPEDRHVSREAGALIAMDDAVLVRNDSTTQPLMLQTFPGPELILEPRAMASSPHRHVRVVVPGSWGSQFALAVDATRLRPAEAPNEADDELLPVVLSKPTEVVNPKLNGRELQLVAALCEPMLLLAGPAAVPATYRQIGDRLSLSHHYVRKRLDVIRGLVADQGVPWLRGDGDAGEISAQNSATYSSQLAFWAVRTGLVTSATLSLLPQRSGG